MLYPMHMRPHLSVLKCGCIFQWADISLAERRNDFGKHIYGLEDPADNTIEFLKILYIYLIGYFSATSFVKFAM